MMGNMAYCRFRNTAIDLLDCLGHMDEPDLSEGEKTARRNLIRVCCEIAVDYADEISFDLD